MVHGGHLKHKCPGGHADPDRPSIPAQVLHCKAEHAIITTVNTIAIIIQQNPLKVATVRYASVRIFDVS